MKHTVKVLVAEEKRGLLGKKQVYSEKKLTVDGKTYRKMQREKKNRPYSVEEMMFYDAIWRD